MSPLVLHQVPVICSGTEGVFELAAVRVRCGCRACLAPGADPYFTPTQWEQHSGAGAAKKWKVSIRVVPGGVPDVPEEANAMMLGRWLESNGLDVRPGGKLTGKGCAVHGGGVAGCLAHLPVHNHLQRQVCLMVQLPLHAIDMLTVMPTSAWGLFGPCCNTR
jgi:hypothetical protein